MNLRTADVTGAWDDMALVGRIARTHGIRGHVIVNLETDFPERRFVTGAVLHVQRDGQVEPLTITSVRFHQGRPILGCAGIDTMTEAERTVGLELRIPPAALSVLPPDTFYRHDLIGCAVATVDGMPVGSVVEVQGAVDGSRLVVRAGGEDVLVPLAAEICVRVDPGERKIVIDPPPGLLELNVTRGTRGPL